jgi:predicted alpha/beta hydrolase family esterase
MSARVLILPGYQNSGSQHWQSLWQQRPHSAVEVQRVMQDDWDAPVCRDWYARFADEVRAAEQGVVLAAHSLGCLLTAYVMLQNEADVLAQIKGALLVAPPDPSSVNFPSCAQGFSPDSGGVLSFPSIVVASTDDPYGSFVYAQSCAERWGSSLINLGERGHINSDSGLNDWPEGWALMMPWLVLK